MLPQELGCGSGMTGWRRVQAGAECGVGTQLFQVLRERLADANRRDWSRVWVDTAHVPTNRATPGTKRHLLCERTGLPRAPLLTPANRHDTIGFEEVLAALPVLQGHRAQPGKLPTAKAYAIPRGQAELARLGIADRMARKGIASSAHLGRHRGVVERAVSRFAAACAVRPLKRYFSLLEASELVAQAVLTAFGCQVSAMSRSSKAPARAMKPLPSPVSSAGHP